jgi:xylulokinase
MRRQRYFAGIDLGTSECKAALFDGRGTMLGEGRAPCRLLHPGPSRVEQDAQEWFEAVGTAVRGALGAAFADGSDCVGIAVSSQGIAFVPVDLYGLPLANAISWLDMHATEETAEVLAAVSQAELYRRTGKRASPAYVLPKLLALRHEQPRLYGDTARFLMAHDYVLRRLGSEPFTDHSLASGTMLYDVSRQGWDGALLKRFGIDSARLPALAWSGSRAGTLGATGAAALGLPTGVPLAVGGQDQKLAALAAGIGPDVATLSLGTASAISRLAGAPVFDPAMRLPLFGFCLPGLWDLEGVVGTTGAALHWLRDTFAPSAAYAALDAEAAAAAPGAGGVRFYPHLAGAGSPHWRDRARGVLSGLSLASTRGDLVRALLEGVAYQVRRNLEAMPLPTLPRAVIAFGGGARSAVWRSIIAEVTGLPVGVTATVEVACLGAAACAAVAAGEFASLAEAREEMHGTVTWQEPAAARRRPYDDLYAQYVAEEARLLGE